jgi:hypothetical protein
MTRGLRRNRAAALKFTLAALFGGGLLFAATPRAHAQACTADLNVINSAVLANNTGAGGHVTNHVSGAFPPPAYRQFHKSLFAGAATYNAAWAAAVMAVVGPTCPVNAPLFSYRVQTIPYPLASSLYCTAANAAPPAGNGQCTAANAIHTANAKFVFRTTNAGGGIHWILLTAYPTN